MAREWVPRRVSSLSVEQHEALENLCTLRHDVHSTDAGDLYNSKSGEFSWLSSSYRSVCEQLSESGFEAMNRFVWEVPDEVWPNDNDWYWILTEEEKEEWERKAKIENRQNDIKRDGNDLFKEECIRKIEESLKKWNTRVKAGLYLFDQVYGTEYCPYGHHVDTTIIENPFGEELQNRLKTAKNKDVPNEKLESLLDDKDFDVVYETLLNENLSSEVLEKQATLIMDRINNGNRKFVIYEGAYIESAHDQNLLIAIIENPNTSPKVLKSLENFDDEYIQGGDKNGN